MKDILAAAGIGSAVFGFVIAVIIGAIILGPLLGAFSGWVVGWIFSETFREFLAWLGLKFEPWQFGLMLGFIGGFFRATLSPKSKD